MSLPREKVNHAERQSRSGYTLLETLLALSLLFVLMAASVMATNLFWQYRSQTADRIMPSLILSGLLEDIGSDLRAVEAMPDWFVPSSFLDPPAGNSQIGERALDFGPEATDQSIHFVGNDHVFALVRNGKNSRFDQAEDLATETQFLVLWLSPKHNEVRLATSRSGNRLIERTYQRDPSQTGLLRFELSSTKQVRSHAIEEVTRMSYRYFDGSAWYPEWSSYLKGQLPRAVEMVVEVNGRLHHPYRTVVAIPTCTVKAVKSTSGTTTSENNQSALELEQQGQRL